MSDNSAPDPDQPGQELDESSGWDEYPPDEPIGLDEVLGEQDDEDSGGDVPLNVLDVEVDDDIDDINGEDPADQLLGDELEPEEPPGGSRDVASRSDDPGQLSEEDEFTGDETVRDYATERVPPPAEEDALHVEPHRLDHR
jgi:hypothetical protein